MAKRVHENKIAIKKIVEIFNTGDLAEVDSLFSSEYVDHQRPAWLDSTGPEEFKQIVLSARKSLPNLQVTIEDLIAEGDRVVARLHWRSTLPAGKNIDRETIDILRFVNGKVVEHWGAEVWTTETTQNDQTLLDDKLGRTDISLNKPRYVSHGTDQF
jgi:predicted SnoaL-like aldol condensation-catalyzing enzyme